MGDNNIYLSTNNETTNGSVCFFIVFIMTLMIMNNIYINHTYINFDFRFFDVARFGNSYDAQSEYLWYIQSMYSYILRSLGHLSKIHFKDVEKIIILKWNTVKAVKY